jgi:hypothetical protein
LVSGWYHKSLNQKVLKLCFWDKFRNIAFAEFTVNLPSQGILSQKRPFLERQMIPGCTNVGITPFQGELLLVYK